MGFFTWIASKAIGGTFGRMFSGVLDYRNVKAGIEAGVIKDVVLADLEINRMKLQLAAVNNQWWVTRWIMPAFAYPVAFHFGAVIADSVFLFDWNVAALPKPLDEWEGQIILSFFIVGTAERLVSTWMNRGIVSSLVTNAKSLFRHNR